MSEDKDEVIEMKQKKDGTWVECRRYANGAWAEVESGKIVIAPEKPPFTDPEYQLKVTKEHWADVKVAKQEGIINAVAKHLEEKGEGAIEGMSIGRADAVVVEALVGAILDPDKPLHARIAGYDKIWKAAGLVEAEKPGIQNIIMTSPQYLLAMMASKAYPNDRDKALGILQEIEGSKL